MSEILIKSKITAPRLRDKIIHRERLNKLLDENINKNLIIISAPAGFGKTTLAIDYLANQEHKYTWLSIPHKGIDDASTFVEYLIGSFRHLNDRFGLSTLELMKSHLQEPKLAKELVQVLTASFINEFIKYLEEDIIIVIDDLHYINTEKSLKWLNEFFNELLNNVPENMHLLLITRTIPDFDLTNLRAKRNLFTMGEKELNFDNNETSLLLEQVYNYKHGNEDVKLLEENLKGWVTGIHLLLQTYGEDFNKVTYSGAISTENIFDFFAHEIFGNLSKDVQKFLLVTGLLENFNADICNSILNINNTQDIINELVHKNLFIHQVNPYQDNIHDELNFYAYHALLKNFLTSKLNEVKSKREINLLNNKIGDFYLAHNDSVSATNYFLEAGNYDKAVPLIINNYNKIYDSGKYDILWNWLNALPDNIVNSNGLLIYFIGYFYCYVNTDYAKSLSYINKAIKLMNIENNEDVIVSCYKVKSFILGNTGKNKSAQEELKKLLINKLKPKNEVLILQSLAHTYDREEKYSESIELLEKVIKLCEKYNIDVKSEIYNAMGISYFNMEEFTKALFYFKKGLEGVKILYNRIVYCSNAAMSYFNLGKYDNAKNYYDKACSLLKNSYSKELLVHVLSQGAILMQEIGDIDGSISLSEKIYDIAEKNNDLIHLWFINDYLFMNYYFMNDYGNCLKYLDKNRVCTEELNWENNRKIFQMREAIYLLENFVTQHVEEKLLDSYAYFEKRKSVWSNLISLYLSEYYLHEELHEAAAKYLKIFLQGPGFTPLDILKSRKIIDFALANSELKIYKGTINKCFNNLFDTLNLEWTSIEYKRKMKTQIETIYDINMISFGSLEFSSRGNRVEDSKWRKKRGKSMLSYMMLNPEAKYNKEKLIDIIFPDIKPETVEENFRQAVFNIRNVFKNPYLNILVYEGKMLYLNPDCYYKSDVLEFEKNYRISRSPEKNKDEKTLACKNAVELYKGGFLEGNYEKWCEDIRNEYENKFIKLSELLLDLLKENQSYEEILDYSEKLLKHDILNEHAYISLIEAYKKLDKVKTAGDAYSRMLSTYEKELGEKPNIKVLTMIESTLAK